MVIASPPLSRWPPQINLEKFKMLFSLIKEVPGLVKTRWKACPFCQHLRQFLKVAGLPNHARAVPFPSWCYFLSAPSEQWTIRFLHKAPTKPNQTRRYTFLPNASFIIKVGLGSSAQPQAFRTLMQHIVKYGIELDEKPSGSKKLWSFFMCCDCACVQNVRLGSATLLCE